MATEVEVKQVYGKNGKANVRVVGSKVKIMFEDENGAAREFGIDDVPEGIETINGVSVSLNAGGDKVYGIRPWDGNHILRFKRFVRDQEGFVNIKHREAREVKLAPTTEFPHGRKWTEPNRLTFTAILGVETPGMAWMEAALTLDHIFEKASNGMMKLVGAPGYIRTMQNFMQLSGYDFASDSLPYGDTLLDELEELLIERDQPFMGTFDKGWLKNKTLSSAPVGSAAKKKTVKKAAPKKAKK
jgi:hypothetical protein